VKIKDSGIIKKSEAGARAKCLIYLIDMGCV
jgi:hypothetical protein